MPFDDLTADGLLDALDAERRISWSSGSTAKMTPLIQELIRRGVYPAATPDHNPNTIQNMVDGWGARWHVWREPHACPHCNADLRDHRAGPPFKREVGVTDMLHDRTVRVYCPDCKQDL